MTDFDLCEDEKTMITVLEDWHSNNMHYWGQKEFLHIIAIFLEDLSDRLVNALEIIDRNNTVSHDETKQYLQEILDRLHKMR